MRRIIFRAGPAVIAVLLMAGAADAQVRSAERIRTIVEAPSRGRIGIAWVIEEPDDRVTISQVLPGTPAAEAGLRVDDVIVRWNGSEDVRSAMSNASLGPGDTVTVRIRRGAERDRDVTLVAEASPRSIVETIAGRDGDVIVVRPGEARRQFQLLRDSLVVHADSMRARIRILLSDSLGPRLEELERNGQMHILRVDSMLAANRGLADALAISRGGVAGAELTDLGEGLATYFQTDGGVLVLRVAGSTPAARAGLQEGDVIVRAGGRAITSVRDLRDAVAGARTPDLEMEVVRRGNRHILMLRR